MHSNSKLNEEVVRDNVPLPSNDVETKAIVKAVETNQKKAVGGNKLGKISSKSKEAARLIGCGMSVTEACLTAGANRENIGRLRYAPGPAGDLFRAIEAESRSLTLNAVITTAQARMMKILQEGEDRDAVGAIRELVNWLKRADESKIKMEELSLKRMHLEQSSAFGENGPIGIVIVPTKDPMPVIDVEAVEDVPPTDNMGV